MKCIKKEYELGENTVTKYPLNQKTRAFIIHMNEKYGENKSAWNYD